MNKSKKRIKVFFILPSLAGGGAERVTLNLIRYLSKERFDAGLIVIGGVSDLLSEVAQNIRYYNLGCKRGRYSLIALARVLHKEKPDIIFASLMPSATVVSVLKLFGIYKGKIINVIHNHFSQNKEKLTFLQYHFYIWALKKSDRILVVSRSSIDDLEEATGLDRKKIQYIENAIDIKKVRLNSNPPISFGGHPSILTAGRLVEVKGYEYVIKAMPYILKKHSRARLYILGKGSEENTLKALVQYLNIENSVTFLGFKRNPYPYFAGADLYAMSSLSEGFGNVLVEALALGAPVVSTDCPFGPREILCNGKYGDLVSPADSKALADGIVKTLENLHDINRQSLKKRADDFAPENVIPKYEKLIMEVVENSE